MTNRLSFWVKQRLMWRYDQIVRFMPNRHLPYRFAGGWIYLNIKEYPTMMARVLGLYEVPKREAIRHFLKPGMTFVDIGSNKGDFSLIAAHIVGPKGRVITFEPLPDNCRWIRKSQKKNGYANLELHEIAVGETDEQTQLFVGQRSGWNTLLPGQSSSSGEVISVRKRRLDSVLAESGNPKVDAIKIDVEGAELSVLQGAEQTLRSNPGAVLFLDIHPHMGVDPQKVADFLQALGFSSYTMQPPYDQRAEIGLKLKELLARRS